MTLEELFILKCKLCTVMFSMDNRDGHFEAKEAKRDSLLEMIELMDGEKTNDMSLTLART